MSGTFRVQFSDVIDGDFFEGKTDLIFKLITMSIDKNENLSLFISGISYLYPDVPDAITYGADKFHKRIYLPQGVIFKQIYFTPGTAEFEEEETEKDGGVIFKQELKLIIPGEDHDTASLLQAIRNRPLLIKITFSNHERKLIGLPENPARFARKQKITGKVSSANISFICSAMESAWWISFEGLYNPITFDSTLITFDSTAVTFDQTHF